MFLFLDAWVELEYLFIAQLQCFFVVFFSWTTSKYKHGHQKLHQVAATKYWQGTTFNHLSLCALIKSK